MELAEIHCYPVKSLRGAARKAAKVELIGLEGDRRFLVVDGSGRFQTIQKFPKMVQIETETSADGVFLRHEDAGACFVSTPRLTSTSSLADLSERVGTFIAMRRFRPNLVVSGATPFAEDTWREIRIGAVRFRVAAPCKRCAITTRDPDTGEQIDPYEPLRTLMRFHRGRDGGAMFGQYLIPDNEGTVGIGDEVEVLSAGASNVM